jgi:hypothetical protein
MTFCEVIRIPLIQDLALVEECMDSPENESFESARQSLVPSSQICTSVPKEDT